jgi:hypothetical protein
VVVAQVLLDQVVVVQVVIFAHQYLFQVQQNIL